MTDPTHHLSPPSDPWAGRAAVPGEGVAHTPPQVIFVEVPRKRRWPWVLGIFGVISVICCGVCVALAAPILKQHPARIAAIPQDVGGLRRDDNPAWKLIAQEAEHRIRSEQEVADAFAAVFADPRASDRAVVVFGATRLFLDPAGDLNRSIEAAGSTISSVTAFDAGRFGGVLSCADGTDGDGKVIIICAWIDHGSIGLGLFYGGRSMADSATFLRELREVLILRP